MNIYDEVEEALEIVGLQSTGNNNEGKVKDMFEYKLLVKALERAKKVEGLFLRLFQVCKEYKDTSVGLSDDSEFINIMKELEEIK